MISGYLSNHFTGIASKRLSAVEIDPTTSNQHEFDGVTILKRIFGTEKQRFKAVFICLQDDEDCFATADGFVTWYDARKRDPQRSEFRLYYPNNDVMELAKKDDLLIIGKRPDDTLMVLVAQAGSTYERQLIWLFGIEDELIKFDVKQIENKNDIELNLAAKFILEELGIEYSMYDERWLGQIIDRFGENFPGTSVFSAFARSTLKGVSVWDDPDSAVMAWLDHEEMLFRTLEKHIVEKDLQKGWKSVDEFISYSLGIQNRRKSRAGWALEHHLNQVFRDYGLAYDTGKETENRSKPDFLFPGVGCYHNPNFPSDLLSMLGVKTSCKDRWRQVLAEAIRIDTKNLFTIQPGISENQTDEMKANKLQLLIPKQIRDTYTRRQQEWLMSLLDFVELVKSREKEANKKGLI